MTRVLAVAALFITARAAAQPTITVGSLRGAVIDQASEPVVGAVVVATSPSLQGTQSELTDTSGHYFLAALPPGTYTLAIYFGKHETIRAGILVRLGSEAVVNVRIATTGEAIEVTGSPPLVDQGSTKIGVTLTEDYTRNIPIGRRFRDTVGAAAGAQEDQYGVSIAGTTSPETTYIVDGVVANDPLYSVLGTDLPPEFIAETEVITGGYGAEYRRATGGIVNVITKQGGNAMHGSVFAYFKPGVLTATARTIQSEGGSIDSRTDLDAAYDIGTELGGPIVKDKLWFHVGFNPHITRLTTTRTISQQLDENQDGFADVDPDTGFTIHVPVTSSRIATDGETYYFTSKLTGALDEHHRWQLTAFGNPTRANELFDITRNPNDVTRRRERGSYDMAGRWTSKLDSGATQLDAIVGWHRTYEVQHGNDVPLVRYQFARSLYDFRDLEPDIGACSDAPTDDRYPKITNCPVVGYVEQGAGVMAARRDDRLAASVALTQRAWLAGYHVVKAGIDAETLYDDTRLHWSGGYSLERLTNGMREGMSTPGRWRLREYMEVRRNLSPAEIADPDSVALGPDESLCAASPGDPSNVHAVCATTDPLHARTSDTSFGAYLQDSWLVLPELSLLVGVRWDRQVAYVSDALAGTVSPFGELRGERAFQVDGVAPRVGVIYDPTRQGHAKLFAHYGRFFENVPITINAFEFSNGLLSTTRLNEHRRLSIDGGYDPSCDVDHGTPNAVDTILMCQDRSARILAGETIAFAAPGLRAQYSDEIVVGADYEILAGLVLGAAYIHRSVPVVIDDLSTDGGASYFIANPGESFDAEAQTLHQRASALSTSGDPQDRELSGVYEARARELEAVKAFDRPSRNYDAAQLTAMQRPTANWLVIASYTYAHDRGNYPGLFSPETGQLAPNINATFDISALLANHYGVLALDRTHNFKADAFYRLGLRVAALTIGASVRIQSGLAYGPLGLWSTDGYESYLLPAGALARTPVTTQVDLHLAIAHRSGLEAFVNVFNLFDRQEVAQVDRLYTIDRVNPIVGGTQADLAHLKALDDTGAEQNQLVRPNKNFGNATDYQPPLSVQLGARYSF